jgi:hypothetical protein
MLTGASYCLSPGVLWVGGICWAVGLHGGPVCAAGVIHTAAAVDVAVVGLGAQPQRPIADGEDRGAHAPTGGVAEQVCPGADRLPVASASRRDRPPWESPAPRRAARKFPVARPSCQRRAAPPTAGQPATAHAARAAPAGPRRRPSWQRSAHRRPSPSLLRPTPIGSPRPGGVVAAGGPARRVRRHAEPTTAGLLWC